MRIGVLALQGCVEPHRLHLESLGAEMVEVRRAEEFKNISALILPGGESTTMLKLIDHFKIFDVLVATAKRIPYWGVCAGSILMAKRVTHPAQNSLAIMSIEVERNGYGRQVDSQQVNVNDYPVAFIRAPLISKLTKNCSVLGRYQNLPVWVREGRHMVTTFHAELTADYPSPFHKMFLASVKNKT